MARLLVHVEGQTEESFVNELLSVDLLEHGFSRVDARILGNARQARRGGIQPWKTVKKEIIRHLKYDTSAYSTLMVDYYGLPSDWPGRGAARSLATSSQRAERIEREIGQEIHDALGAANPYKRFVPYIVMHEFEGLLFSDCDSLAAILGSRSHADLCKIRGQFRTPEDINDSPQTAPSKRLMALVSNYEKPLHRVIAADEVGLDTIARECPGFSTWLERLRTLATYSAGRLG